MRSNSTRNVSTWIPCIFNDFNHTKNIVFSKTTLVYVTIRACRTPLGVTSEKFQLLPFYRYIGYVVCGQNLIYVFKVLVGVHRGFTQWKFCIEWGKFFTYDTCIIITGSFSTSWFKKRNCDCLFMTMDKKKWTQWAREESINRPKQLLRSSQTPKPLSQKVI